MKRTLLLVALVIGLASLGYAGDCSVGTMADYTAGGFSCTIGDLTFSNFSFTSSGGGPSAGDVAVTPVDGSDGSGFQFNSLWAASGNGPLLSDTTISYTVTAASPIISDLHLGVPAFASVNGGQISITENADNGANLYFYYDCTGTPGTCTEISQLDATFAPVESLMITKDIGVSCPEGQDCRVSVSEVVNTTTQVPEPATLTLLGTGLLGMGGFFRRRFKSLK